ncbi:MAG: hypothetical protein Q7S58_10605 [Candidatus Binatus sp.]|uniref:hypothetical protein n=1 Tax=Candidatus Binatus sp. TaxID=2811406 RepID=UPI00271E2765|nr:hypothetical protein [Candidatus Binatus sp.]MDO8432844.1 hypothetical protein [Candidatus Binatus sp.]
MDKITSNTAVRGWFLTVMAVLFVVLAVSNFTKAIQYKNNPAVGGLVVFGYKLQGVGINAVAGPLFGLILLAYAFGLWRMRPWVIPLSVIYAFYVPYNLVLFWFLHTDARPSVQFIVQYLAIALTGSVGTALYVAFHKDRFQN